LITLDTTGPQPNQGEWDADTMDYAYTCALALYRRIESYQYVHRQALLSILGYAVRAN